MGIEASTGRRYSDGRMVPFPVYRCKAKAIGSHPRGAVRQTHQCKAVVDHGGNHSCICGLQWETPKEQSNG